MYSICIHIEQTRIYLLNLRATGPASKKGLGTAGRQNCTPRSPNLEACGISCGKTTVCIVDTNLSNVELYAFLVHSCIFSRYTDITNKAVEGFVECFLLMR